MAEMYEQEKGSNGNDNNDKEEEEEDKEDKDEEGEDKDDKLATRLDLIRSMLQKVSLCPIDPNSNSWLTNGEMHEAVEHCIHNEELNNHPLAGLEQDPPLPWPLCVYDAVGCFNMLEFAI